MVWKFTNSILSSLEKNKHVFYNNIFSSILLYTYQVHILTIIFYTWRINNLCFRQFLTKLYFYITPSARYAPRFTKVLHKQITSRHSNYIICCITWLVEHALYINWWWKARNSLQCYQFVNILEVAWMGWLAGWLLASCWRRHIWLEILNELESNSLFASRRSLGNKKDVRTRTWNESTTQVGLGLGAATNNTNNNVIIARRLPSTEEEGVKSEKVGEDLWRHKLRGPKKY